MVFQDVLAVLLTSFCKSLILKAFVIASKWHAMNDGYRLYASEEHKRRAADMRGKQA